MESVAASDEGRGGVGVSSEDHENGFSCDHFGAYQLLPVLWQPTIRNSGRTASAHRVKELRMARVSFSNGRDGARETSDLPLETTCSAHTNVYLSTAMSGQL